MRRILLPLSLLLLVTAVAGCGRGSFVGRRYDNFSAYYNTFYNAERTFEQGVEGIEGARQQPIDRDVYLPLFGSTGRAAQAQAFDAAIQKSADLLRKHPDSKWVDDALLLIGKSYFYLQNWAGAEQKFREVMTLPETRLADEARFWLARTYIAAGNYDAAAAHLTESLAREDLSRRWAPKLRLAEAELDVQRRAWDGAVAALEAGLEGVGDRQLEARAHFLLGQLYETLGRYQDAVVAYDRSAALAPFYELSYAALVSAIRVEGAHGEAEAALRRLRRMERDDKHYENRAELAYLRGRIYQAMGRPDDALDAFYRLLYDSDANVSAVRGPAHYTLGAFFRDVDRDYRLAAAHFDTAAQSLGAPVPPGQQAPLYAPAAITDAAEQARTFGAFAEAAGTIERLDSLLYLGSLDDDAYAARVLELRQQKADELAAEQAELERRRLQQGFGAGAAANGAGVRGKQLEGTQTGSAESGFLFHRDPIRVQEGMAGFIDQWGERALAPDWRRASALTGLADPLGQQAVIQEDTFIGSGANLPEIDLVSIPRDSLSRALMRRERALARYELGNVLFLSMDRPDSAAAWYRMVIEEEDAETPVTGRAYYALAEVQRALGDSTSAARLYRTILDRYPDSEFAGQARERLGLAYQQAVAADSTALAEAAYEAAYRRWQQGAYEEALEDLITLAARYRDTPTAPRALFAAGAVFQEWAARDSLDLYAPLPITVPDSVVAASGLREAAPAAPPGAAPVTPPAGAVPPQVFSLPDQPSDSLAGEQPLQPGRILPVPSSDPSGVPPDTTAMAADSVAVLPAVPVPAEAAAPDSTAGPEPVRLETLYASLVRIYPQAPQAAQARRVIDALEERRPQPEAAPDSTGAPADSLAAPPAVAAEEAPDEEAAEDVGRSPSVGGLLDRAAARRPPEAARPDSTATDADAEAAEGALDLARRREELQRALAARGEGLEPPGAAPADAAAPPARPVRYDVRTRGGWVIVVASATDSQRMGQAMRSLQQTLGATGHPLEVYPGEQDGQTRLRIGLGAFETEAEAQATRAALEDVLPPDAWLLYIPPRRAE